MNVIVFDLETTLQRTPATGIKEVIEIGAVKLRLNNNTPTKVDTFHQYVLTKSGKMLIKDQEFIGMKEGYRNLNKAVRISKAIYLFYRWIGEEDYYLCSWSDSDLSILMNNFAYNHMFRMRWIKNYNDLQKAYMKILGKNKQISLKKSIKLSGIDMQGDLHNAVDDAENAAKIYSLYSSHIRLERNNPYEAFIRFNCPLYLRCTRCNKIKYINKFPFNKGAKNGKGCCSNCWKIRRRKKAAKRFATVINNIAQKELDKK